MRNNNVARLSVRPTRVSAHRKDWMGNPPAIHEITKAIHSRERDIWTGNPVRVAVGAQTFRDFMIFCTASCKCRDSALKQQQAIYMKTSMRNCAQKMTGRGIPSQKSNHEGESSMMASLATQTRARHPANVTEPTKKLSSLETFRKVKGQIPVDAPFT
jgi:hypothetical protein